MPDGITVPLFVARLNKKNAKTVYLESERLMEWMRQRLLMLAANRADPGSLEDLQHEVSNLVDEIASEGLRLCVAEFVVNFPDECQDDLENPEVTA